MQAATPVTFEFAGTITETYGTDLVSVGEPFSGRFRFDADVPDWHTLDPEIGVYEEFPLAISNFYVRFNSFAYTLEPDGHFTVTTQLNRQFDNDHVSYETGNEPVELHDFPDVNYVGTRIELWAPAGTLLSDAIVTSVDLDDFSLRQMFTFYAANTTHPTDQLVFLLQGDITSLTVVPEPCGILLVASAFSCMIAQRRRSVG